MGGVYICEKCDTHFHSHDGGGVIDDGFYCENCMGHLEYEAELRAEQLEEE